MTGYDWGHPTPEMVAALRLARRCTARHGLTEIEVAEWAMEAPSSLWYLQAARWSDAPPTAIAVNARTLFQDGCRTIVQIVDLGYHAEMRQWWPFRTLWPAEAEWGSALLILMDTGMMIQRLPDVTSAGFGIFFDLVCGPRWEQRYRAAIMAAEQQIQFPPGRRRRR